MVVYCYQNVEWASSIRYLRSFFLKKVLYSHGTAYLALLLGSTFSINLYVIYLDMDVKKEIGVFFKHTDSKFKIKFG